MSLLYAFGLLGLIGIPVLIFIYIIKNKYTEQTVTSTYLWTLSERFAKKRIPINRIVGIISLILQILAVALISLLIAHPVVILPGAAKAYCFILDGSGSMNIEQDGKTRFELGKERIEDMIVSSAKGSTYSLIYIGTTTETVFSRLSDKDRALETLGKLDVAYIAPDPFDVVDRVQKYYTENRAVEYYLVTDTAYEIAQHVQVINVTEGHEPVANYAVSDVAYDVKDGKLTVTGNVLSYENDGTVALELSFLDGGSGAFVAASQLAAEVVKGESSPFTFTVDRIDFEAFRVAVTTPDALALDSEAVVYNVKFENIADTLLVSDSPFYMRSALTSAGNTRLDVKTTAEYAAETPAGYGLYIFDNYSPAELPREGAVWFVDPQSTVQGSNFSYQGPAPSASIASFSDSTSTSVRRLLEGVSMRNFDLAGYVKCGVSGKFSSLITCNGSPLLFVGTNAYGNREAVFAFDLHDSAPFTLSSDFSVIVSNLLSYSFPSVIEETSYICGENMLVNVVTGCESILVTTPNGGQAYLDTSSAVSEYTLNEVGSYSIEMTMRGSGKRVFNVFSALPFEERVPTVEAYDFVLNGRNDSANSDGIYDELLLIFLVLAAVAVADYGVYCYEQYQLR